MKKLLSFLAVLPVITVATAQTRKITVTVTNEETGEALPGVSIIIKHPEGGFTTNAGGKLSIPNNNNVVLLFISTR
jgi:TonB-dependent starch-binding outer membrane protein SusC